MPNVPIVYLTMRAGKGDLYLSELKDTQIKTEEEKADILLSVVIIGLNEARIIGQCIESVKSATAHIPRTETVYVDSRSTDETVSIALSKGVKVFQLGKTQPPSPAAGRYVGSLVTHGRFIIFVDGDSIVAPGWIEPAIELMMRDTSIVMFSGTLFTGQADTERVLSKVESLGTLKSVYQVSGSWAPIVSRQALNAAGNWNPFVRCREEADLAIRLRHCVPGSRIVQSDQYTVDSPKCSVLNPAEVIRRCKIGFIKGPGQILRNAIAGGYLSKCWNIAQTPVLSAVLILGVGVSIAAGFWWQFLLLFFGAVFLRAILTGKLVRLGTLFYSIVIGTCSLWEFLSVSVRQASDYKRDFKQIRPQQ